MTDASTSNHPLPKDKAEQALLREMAQDMGVALYRRYNAAEAADLIGVPAAELERLRTEGRIAYLQISATHIGFFGCQLLTVLRECIVPVGVQPPERAEPAAQPAKPVISPDAELVSVKDAAALLGIGRTKLYELINSREIDSVKIGTRTLIKQASLRRLTGGNQPE